MQDGFIAALRCFGKRKNPGNAYVLLPGFYKRRPKT
jgi:hypothetical protein